MNKHFYFQHGIMSFNDPRIQAMIDKEGSKGYGTYWYIMEKLSLLPDARACFLYLKPFACRKFTYTYMMRIITDFELFAFDGDFFVPVELNADSVRWKGKTRRHACESTPGNNRENENEDNEKCPKSDAKSNETERFSTEKGARVDENAKMGNPDFDVNAQEINALPNYVNEQKRNIKNITTTAKEKEDPAAIDEVAAAVDDAVSSLHPVRPWRELVDSLSPDSAWGEVACMKSGYGELLRRRFREAVELFMHHILLYDKGGSLLTLSDVHQYFANFTAPGCRTSQTLREALLKLDAAKHSAASNPYCHEQRIGGRRTYMGCPIPDEAPPRPADNALWNDAAKEWVLPEAKIRPVRQ